MKVFQWLEISLKFNKIEKVCKVIYAWYTCVWGQHLTLLASGSGCPEASVRPLLC